MSLLLGWLSAFARGFPFNVFGVFLLPAMAVPKGSTAGDVNIYTMWGSLARIALHASAALYLQFFSARRHAVADVRLRR